MPWGDGTGPWWSKGRGGAGYGRGFGRGRGFGFGFGFGRGRGWRWTDDYYYDDQEAIKREIDFLTDRLNFLKSRLRGNRNDN